MFAKFNLELSNKIYDIGTRGREYYKCIGERIYKECDDVSKKNLSAFIKENGTIDGTAMQKEWFNQVKADVFLSHSHKDIENVKTFAGWLKAEFGLETFIDSCVWGYCDNLLNQIDNNYCKNDNENTYNYTRRNYSTSHVHMMLSVSLAKMMDSTECVIFLNTPNSINWQDELSNLKENNSYKTLSPWIYDELAMTSMLRINTPTRYDVLKHGDAIYEYSDLQIEYEVTKFIEEMTNLNCDDLRKWKENLENSIGNKTLDKLYLLKGLIKENYDSILFG